MPLYEWKCTRCKHEFEELTPMNVLFSPCPRCGGDANRQLSTQNFHLKGEGFYSTRDRYEG